MGSTQTKLYNEGHQNVYNFDNVITGDLVKFRESHISLISTSKFNLVKKSNNIFWDHVGIVINMPDLYPKYGPLLLEGGLKFNDGLVDISTMTIKQSGVRLVVLKDRMKQSNNAQIMHLHKVQNFKNEKLQDDIELIKIITAVTSDNVFDLFNPIIKKPHSNAVLNPNYIQPRIKGPEIIAYCLNEIGLLPPNSKLSHFNIKSITDETEISKLISSQFKYITDEKHYSTIFV